MFSSLFIYFFLHLPIKYRDEIPKTVEELDRTKFEMYLAKFEFQIQSMYAPIGSREMPARSCKDLFKCFPDALDGEGRKVLIISPNATTFYNEKKEEADYELLLHFIIMSLSDHTLLVSGCVSLTVCLLIIKLGLNQTVLKGSSETLRIPLPVFIKT